MILLKVVLTILAVFFHLMNAGLSVITTFIGRVIATGLYGITRFNEVVVAALVRILTFIIVLLLVPETFCKMVSIELYNIRDKL
jgi:hypothetical protein